MIPPPPRSTLFPYTTLFRSSPLRELYQTRAEASRKASIHTPFIVATSPLPTTDRKSTRLNSSHVEISYAVFCLKKKKKTIIDNYIAFSEYVLMLHSCDLTVL